MSDKEIEDNFEKLMDKKIKKQKEEAEKVKNKDKKNNKIVRENDNKNDNINENNIESKNVNLNVNENYFNSGKNKEKKVSSFRLFKGQYKKIKWLADAYDMGVSEFMRKAVSLIIEIYTEKLRDLEE